MAVVAAKASGTFRNSVAVCSHHFFDDTSYWHWNEICQKLNDIGIRRLRDGMGWSTDGPWNAARDEEIRIAAFMGFKFLMGYVGNHNEPLSTREARFNKIGEYASKGWVVGLEGPNEFDHNHGQAGGVPADWPNVLRGMLTWAKQRRDAHPVLRTLPLIGPTIVAINDPQAVSKLGDIRSLITAGNIHPYTGAKMPTAENLSFNREKYRAMFGDLPLWATECGYHTATTMKVEANQPPASERAQGIYLIRTYCENSLYGIPWTSPYEAIDLRQDPATEAEYRFGMLRADRSYKPAATWLKRFLAQIGDGGTAGSLDISVTQPSDGLFRYMPLRQADGKYKIAVWRNVSVWERDIVQTVNGVRTLVGGRKDLYPALRVARFHMPAAKQVRVAFPCAPPTGCGGDWQTMQAINGPYFDVGLAGEPAVLEVTV